MKHKYRKDTDLTPEQNDQLKELAEEYGMPERSVLRLALIWFYKFHKFFNKLIK